MIRVVCSCGRAFKAEDRHAGKHTKCPECGADLTIGPAPISTSPGGNANEVPAWWYPSEPTDQAERATAPTRSGSDPGSDAIDTMELPPGYNPKPQPSTQSPPASASTSASLITAEGFGRDPIAGAGESAFPDKETLGDRRWDRRSFGSRCWGNSLAPLTGSWHRRLIARTAER